MEENFSVNQKVQAMDITNGVWSPAIIQKIDTSQVILYFHKCLVPKLRYLTIPIPRNVAGNRKKWPIREDPAVVESTHRTRHTQKCAHVKEEPIHHNNLMKEPHLRTCCDTVFANVHQGGGSYDVKEYVVAINDPFRKTMVLLHPDSLDVSVDFREVWMEYIDKPATLYSDLRDCIPRECRLSPPRQRVKLDEPDRIQASTASSASSSNASTSNATSSINVINANQSHNVIMMTPIMMTPMSITVHGETIGIAVCSNGVLQVNQIASFMGTDFQCKG